MSWLFPSFRERQRRGYTLYKAATLFWSIPAIIGIVFGAQNGEMRILALGIVNLALVFSWAWLAKTRPRLGMLWAGSFFAADAFVLIILFGPDAIIWALPAFMCLNALVGLLLYRNDFEPEAIP